MKSAHAHYCQKCSSANRVGERHCRACGTRLMLVVFPPSIRHDEAIVPTFYEDHLLERVSLLEVQLAQAMEKIAMISAFFAREAKELKKEQKFVRAFAEALGEANPQTAQKLSESAGENAATDLQIRTIDASGKRKHLAVEIIARHGEPNAPLFAHLLNEGIRLLDAGEEKQSFQMLERAALLSPRNERLFVFIAESYYRADKFKESKTHLERAFALAPDNEKVLLLLGALCAEAGEADDARKFLSVLASNQAMAFVVYFIWGMLAAAEENWTEALAAFRQAAEKKSDSAEIDYLVGCVHFQLGEREEALRHFQKTTAADFKFSDAWLMQSLVYKTGGNEDLQRTPSVEADAALEQDSSAESDEAATALPFRHFKKRRKNLLTGGAPRLNRFFREQIFRLIEPENK